MWRYLKLGCDPPNLRWGLAVGIIAAGLVAFLVLGGPRDSGAAIPPVGEMTSSSTPGVEYDICLDINDTSTHDDDYVPTQRTTPSTTAVNYAPYNYDASNSTVNGKGNPDNSVPMRIKNCATTSALITLNVRPTTTASGTTASGSVLIMLDSSGTNPYPATGVRFSASGTMDVLLYGTQSSSATDDVTIEAKVGNEVRGCQTLTVLGVKTRTLRTGSTNTGAALVGVYAKWPTFLHKYQEIFVYPNNTPGWPAGLGENLRATCEAEYQLQPDVVYSKLGFQVPQYASAASWLTAPPVIAQPQYLDSTNSGVTNFKPDGAGKTNWIRDGACQEDGNFNAQTHSSTHIFKFDGPGAFLYAPAPGGATFSCKWKFVMWLEVRIGDSAAGKWYIMEAPQMWHSISHTRFDGVLGHWGLTDTTNTVETDANEGSCPLPGFAGQWTENGNP
jgi:hypothetical protein